MRTEDGSIIQECINGEPGAFGILVDKYKEGIYAFVYTKLQDFQDAQDVTQEVFLRAYRDLRSLRKWESFAFWLYRIAYARCAELLKLESKRADQGFIEDQSPEAINTLSLSSYHADQLNKFVREFLNSLPEIHREVLVLCYFGGMKSSEMAKALGISPAAVRKRLSRARAQLRKEMIAMMDTAFDGQGLPAGFTIRVVEMLKQMKIQPIPRSTRLPWGLSLATGIIIAIMSIGSHLSSINPHVFPSGQPLPMKMKVLKTGEIPVDMVKTSQTLAIASRPENRDSGEIRPGGERGDLLLAPQASEVKLKPRDGAAGDGFGNSVAIYGDYAIVGAYWKDEGRGAAYIFKRDGDSWKEQKALFADDGREGDCFGWQTTISDEFAAVGAPYDDDKGEDTGSVYVFRRTGESWTQQAKLNPHGQFIKWCEFGIGVAISGDYLVVGAHAEEWGGGAVYIFKRDGNTWGEQAKLKSSDWARGDWFGEAVSISGDYVIAAAPHNNTGSAYVFKREGDIWKEQSILTANDGKAGDAFGVSTAISGDYAIVGACWHKDKTGAAYISMRQGSSWKQQAKLMPDDLSVGNRFGQSVCVFGGYAIASSPGADGKKGAIYGFMRDGDTWKRVSKLTASDGTAGDDFGAGIAFSGNYAIIGATGADVSGAAYIYHLTEFFSVEPSGSSATTFGGEKDKPALPDLAIPPPEKQPVPMKFRLLQNFPNPFNPETWLPYELASDADITIRIYDSRGGLVRKLILGMQRAGSYISKDKAAYWDGKNEAGEAAASDVYFYAMAAGGYKDLRKMILAR